MVKAEDVKRAFLQSFGNFVSPLTQTAVGPELRNDPQAYGFVKKPMHVGIVSSRSAVYSGRKITASFVDRYK
jgi:hypothetical protein